MGLAVLAWILGTLFEVLVLVGASRSWSAGRSGGAVHGGRAITQIARGAPKRA